MAIIAVLASLIFPALASSKRSAQVSDSQQRLRQAHVAITLYRSDHEGAGLEGTGLPDLRDLVDGMKKPKGFYGIAFPQFTSACGLHPSAKTASFIYLPVAGTLGAYPRHRQRLGERSVLLVDEQCNNANVDLRAPYMTKTGLAVLLDGSLVRRRGVGNVGSVAFWDTNE
jgi:type II secretory pathway pseudopilin PulG